MAANARPNPLPPPDSGSGSGDRPYPTSNMLLPFRVRKIRPTGEDGVVRMKRDDYTELLKLQPTAALRYIDESDGEVILVGSSHELDERLQERIEKSSIANAGVTLELHGRGFKQLHTFEVAREAAVVETWQRLDKNTTAEGQRAMEMYFGRSLTALDKGKQNVEVVREAAVIETRQPESRKAMEMYFGRSATAQDKGKQNVEVRFGQVSPPRSSLQASPNSAPGNAHASRWASYSNLPASFNHEPVPVMIEPKNDPFVDPLPAPGITSIPGHFAANQLQPPALAPRSAFDVMVDTASAPVRSSTLQVPTSQKQKNEYQPLIDMFFTEGKASDVVSSEEASKVVPSVEVSEDHPKQWQPLLDLFEGQLAELAVPSAIETPGSGPALKGPFAQKSGELLAQSIQSLLNGVGVLAATFRKTNAELQQQIAVAQQDFPNNIEKALKTSIAAIESLRSMVPAANIEASVPAQAAEGSEENSRVSENSAADAQRSTKVKKKILLYRYKLQKYFLRAPYYPSREQLQMLNDIVLDLEIAWKGLDAELLMETRIPKVMKAIGRMDSIPGDEEFSFRARCADILSSWRKTIETHQLGELMVNKVNEVFKSNDAVEALPTVLVATSLDFTEPTISKQACNTLGETSNSANDADPALGDDQVDRVELATETMRRQLLEMELLPPTERPLGGVYTRADVLEAYIQKFNELKSMTGQSGDAPVEPAKISPPEPAKPDLYHDFDQWEGRTTPRMGHRSSLDDFYFNQEGQRTANESNVGSLLVAGYPVSDLLVPSVPKAVKELARVPKKAVSFDHLAAEIGRNVLPPTVADMKKPGRAPTVPNASSTQRQSEGQEPSEMSWSMSYYPGSLQRQVRHRQSWHPASTPGPSHDTEYPFSFSTSDVMARYPPISQINQNPHLSSHPYLHQAADLPSAATEMHYRSSISQQPYTTPNEPTLWRSSTFSTNYDEEKKADEPFPASSMPWLPVQIASKPEINIATKPPESPAMESAAQRSTSTRITRAEKEKLRAEKQQRKNGRVAERRRRRLEGESEARLTAEQLAEEDEKQGEIQKCIVQLTAMGFARGKSDAVAAAVLGNLEMALDVLNEDSAAWEAKARQDGQRETRRQREDVPGSWGSWDDELYG